MLDSKQTENKELNLNDEIINKSLDRTKDYLSNIEKIFGKHLKEEEKGNYDGDLETSGGEQTEIERYYKEDFSKLKDKLEGHKDNLTKQTLVTTLLHEMLKEKGIEYQNVSKKIDQDKRIDLAKELNEEQVNFTKDITDLGKDLDKSFITEEITYTKKQVETANHNYKLALELGLETDDSKIGKADTSMSIMSKYESDEKKLELQTRLLNKIEKENKQAYMEYAELLNENEKDKGSVSSDKLITAREKYEQIVVKNSDIAYKHGVGELNLDNFNKILEYGMVSGIAPVAMMVTPVIKKAIPVLPAVIGVGIWTRMVHTMQSEKMDTWEKSGEMGKIISYTLASIAPITGTGIAGYETKEAYYRYKEGKGDFGDVVANGAGTVISAIFDGVTIFLIATGVGAAPAVGVQATKGVAKEATKTGIKKFIGYFTTSEGREIAAKNSTNSFKSLFGGKTSQEVISGEAKYSTKYSLNTAKEVWTEIGKDTLNSFKQIFTLKQTRDIINKGIFMIPRLGDKYAELRPSKFIQLKSGTEKSIAMEGSILAKSSIEKNNDTGTYTDPILASNLGYIDSLKNDYSIEAGDKLLKELESVMTESKKLEKIQEKLLKDEIKYKDDPIKFKKMTKRLIDEKNRLLASQNVMDIKINKILDIINFRTKQIKLYGNNNERDNNIIIREKTHEITKSILGNKHVDTKIKMIVFDSIWNKSVDDYGYDKSGELSKFITDIFKIGNINDISGVIKGLNSKFSNKQMQNLLSDTKFDEFKLGNIKTIENLASKAIEKYLDTPKNKIDIYHIEDIYLNIGGLKYNKELTNKIINITKENFENYRIEEQMITLSFINKYGDIQDFIKGNEGIEKSISLLINSHNNESNDHLRGLYNLHNYLIGTSFQKQTDGLVLNKIYSGDKEKLDFHNKLITKNNIINDIRALNKEATSEQITDFIKLTLNSISNKKDGSNKDLLYNSDDIINLVKHNKDKLKGNIELQKFLFEKIEEIDKSSNSQELMIIVKILGETGYKKDNFSEINHLTDFTKTLFIKNEIIKYDKEIGNQKEGLVLDYLIGKIKKLGTDGITSKDEKYILDQLYTFDLLGTIMKQNDFGKTKERSYRDKFKYIENNFGEKINENINIILNSKEGFIGNYRTLTDKLGFDIEIVFGKGIFLRDNTGTNNVINLKISDLTNLKGELIGKAISNSTYVNTKYKENLGYLNTISYKTKFHDFIKSSDNQVFNNILNIGREYELIKTFDQETILKLIEEYKIDNRGTRFNNKVFIINNLLVDIKSSAKKNENLDDSLKKEIIDILIKDVKNPEYPTENKLSLIYNIQDYKIQIQMFEALLESKTLKLEDLEHDLFKKVIYKVDSLKINHKLVDEILNLEDGLIKQDKDSINKLYILISTIQQNTKIGKTDIVSLTKLFETIASKQDLILDSNVGRIYDDMLLEFSRIEVLQNNPKIAKYLSSSIINETDRSSEKIKTKIYTGLRIIEKYKNIEYKINNSGQGIKDFEELAETIKKVLIEIGQIRSNDLLNKKDLEELLGKKIIEGLARINLEVYELKNGEVYYKIINLDTVFTQREIMEYQKAISKLSDIIIGGNVVIRGSDLTEYFSNEQINILEQAGFNKEEFIKYKNGEVDMYISDNRVIDDIINFNKDSYVDLLNIILSVKGFVSMSEEEKQRLEAEYILLINKIDSLDVKIRSDKDLLKIEIDRLIDESDELKKYFKNNKEDYDIFIMKSIESFGPHKIINNQDFPTAKSELENMSPEQLKEMFPKNADTIDLIQKIDDTPANNPILIPGTNLSFKKAMIILVSLGIMMPDDAEAAIADWKKLENMNPNSQEYKKLRAETISKVTKLYLEEFDKDKYKIKMKEKIDKLDVDLQGVFLKAYETGIEHISDQKLQTKYSMYLLTFFEKYNELAGNSEKYAKTIADKVPGLPKDLTDALISFGKESDELIKTIKQQNETIKQQKIILKLLDKLNSL